MYYKIMKMYLLNKILKYLILKPIICNKNQILMYKNENNTIINIIYR